MRGIKKDALTRRQALTALTGAGAAGLVAGCAQPAADKPEPLQLDLNDPADWSYARQKVIGSVADETTHAFMRLHMYGQVPGEKARPLLSMNNYLIEQWEPVEYGTYKLRHWEVGYYCEFDTDNHIESWVNPYTQEELEPFHFVLGPIERVYTPETVMAPGLAPLARTSHLMGDRYYVTTEAISQFPNLFTPDEWPKFSSGQFQNWLSLQTLSALWEDVVNPQLNSAPNNMHLQNFVSWASWLRMGEYEGGTTVRGFGTEIPGFDALEPNIRAALEKYTPEIFETDTWTTTRFDEIDFFNEMKAKREAGEI